ncbi:arsenite methyltransferase [Desulfobacterales bacterium HSG2]|nr:arsenite methyltransferase [Desulfobacterales bacterium HSG2]
MEDIREVVRDKYGEIAKNRTSCCGPAASCCGSKGTDDISRDIGYSDEELSAVPDDANLGLGCGNPTAIAMLRAGEVVLDLGSGGGLDCFIAAKKVGDAGRVIGVDMTPDMVSLARKNAVKVNAGNVEFRLGEIENLPVADKTADVIISNCVINLSPDKKRVFEESYRALKPGGRMMISDIVLLRPLPEKIRESIEAYVGCVSGALLKEDYLNTITSAGFENVSVTGEQTFAISGSDDPYLKSLTEQFSLSPEQLKDVSSSIVSVSVNAEKMPNQKGETTGSKAYFDDVADQWDTMRKNFFSENVRETAFNTVNIQSGKLAADIGAGTGFVTEGLIRKGLKVIAVDQSREMLDEMRRKFGDHDNTDFRQGTAERLPVEDGSVDYAFANMYLHHVESPPEAIKEMTRILKPGGKLAITDMDEHNFEFLRLEHHDRWMGFKREDVEKWFREAGLRDVAVDCAEENCCAASDCGCEEASISIFVASGQK